MTAKKHETTSGNLGAASRVEAELEALPAQEPTEAELDARQARARRDRRGPLAHLKRMPEPLDEALQVAPPATPPTEAAEPPPAADDE